MQRKSKPNPSGLSVTFPHLSRLNESSLLEIAVSVYHANHPLEKPHHAISQRIGIAVNTFDQHVAGIGSIGLNGWAEMAKLIGRDLASEWLAARKMEDKP